MFMFDIKNMVQVTFGQKLLNIVTLVVFMLFITQLIAGFFIIKSSYDKHAKYFYDNCSNTLKGSVSLLVEYGLLNFCLGSVHLLL